ncbi:pyridoxamine 5'-phosphate oxidase family protein [Steroidobacter sp.]|uniref:pyridoxamine 5'-phosphate oxidase family protein n=1 Tax=Steroidobacter sp. TaxID=1978227 RepID=UPI001A37E203|nr:pyridoxamine 5'-phosphate oxidase family protein [Steroidobacter sp.]MBL8267072.1 pyridoxamine 5'-phosphate oxidase family protein [Steroidobacter sp.]
MHTTEEWQHKLWKGLASDRTVMLGLTEIENGYPRPMTAQVQSEDGRIWFFTARENALVQLLTQNDRAFATFASKGHDLFATIHGTLHLSNDRAMIDRLWNRFVAAWFEQGKEDPKLALLRFDPEHAEIWEDASSVVAGAKMLLGFDPKKEYRDRVADVPLTPTGRHH